MFSQHLISQYRILQYYYNFFFYLFLTLYIYLWILETFKLLTGFYKRTTTTTRMQVCILDESISCSSRYSTLLATFFKSGCKIHF